MPTRHDRIFKEFLHRFLKEFMELFFPAEAAYLDFSSLTWLEQELISNFPNQKLRVSDVAAEAKTVKGEEKIVLIHIEIESHGRETFPGRMFEYYSLFRTLRQKPVLPLACMLSPQGSGLQWQHYQETLFGHTIVDFHFGQVALPDLPGAEYLARQEPVAAALAALMDPGAQPLASVKLSALQTVVGSGLTEGDKLFLINLVETYLPRGTLPPAGEDVMEPLAEYEKTYIEEAMEEGLERGLEQGLEKGLEQGLQQGIRDSIIEVLLVRFGEAPAGLQETLETITDLERLRELHRESARALTLTDFVQALEQDQQDQR